MRTILSRTAIVMFVAALVNAVTVPAAESAKQPGAAQAAESQQPRDERLQWWRQARFGMFMHWGLYAIPAGEWKGLEKKKDLWGEWIMERAQIPVTEYEQLARQFNPVKFDAEAWARIIRQAGMKYLVITAKHCDGFAMFKSQASRYNIVDATPFARDPMAELAAALPKENLRLGFYYSHCWDWHEPDALGHDNRWDFPDRTKKQVERYLTGKSLPQVKELATQYHPSLMWFDVPSDITREQSAEFVKTIRAVMPDCIINDRVGNGLGDYGTPEQFIPRQMTGKDFEVCMTLNNHWGFDRNDHQWKSAGQVIAKLAEIAGKGGNFLLDVGPTADGSIPEPAVKVLQEVGQWLELNGASIYGTQAGPLTESPWGWCTAKPGTLYLHVLHWPAGGRLLVPGLKNKVRVARLLANPGAVLKTERLGENDWIVGVPEKAPDTRDTVVALSIDGAPSVEETWTLNPLPGAANRLACPAAVIHGSTLKRKDLSLADPVYDYFYSWTKTQDWLSWKFRAPQPATYEMRIVYNAAAPSAGNTFAVQIGDRTLTAKVQNTGGGDTVNTLSIATPSFKEFSLGTVTIPATAEGVVLLKPLSLASGSPLMQFHALILRPVGGDKQ